MSGSSWKRRRSVAWNNIAATTLEAQKEVVDQQLMRHDASKLSEKQQNPVRAFNQ